MTPGRRPSYAHFSGRACPWRDPGGPQTGAQPRGSNTSTTRGRAIIRRPDGAATELDLGPRLRLGRAADNDVVVDDQQVSRHHAEIRRDEDGGYTLIDLGSANGTDINGRLLTMPARLRDGDVVGVGSMTLAFHHEQVSAPLLDDAEDLTLAHRPVPERLVLGASPQMAQILHLVDTAARSPIPVLLEGETGTGKELVARGIHAAGARSNGPFVAVNCAALAETLLESELFGHRRGAFTGASQDHRGHFEAASGGTIFLDEVGEMSAAMQAKLLRVLEGGEIVPVGETRPRKIDVRIISATNRDLHAEVERGTFRGDLYYRLAAFPIHLPPLRARREDIPLLAKNAVLRAAQRHGKRVPGIAPAEREALQRFSWPGNVRELRNELQRAVALARDGETIQLRHLSERIAERVVPPRGAAHGQAPSSSTDRTASPGADVIRAEPSQAADRRAAPLASEGGPGTSGSAQPEPRALPDGSPPSDLACAPETSTEAASSDLREARAAFEARFIAEVLAQSGGHIGKTARALGLSRVALHKKLKDYGIR